MRHDLNVPNPSLSMQWEKAEVIHATGPSTFKVRRPGRKKKKLITLNIQQLRPRTTDFVEEEQPHQQAINAIELLFEPSAIQTCNQAAAHWIERGIPYSLSFTPDGGMTFNLSNRPSSTANPATPNSPSYEVLTPPPATIRSPRDAIIHGELSWGPNARDFDDLRNLYSPPTSSPRYANTPDSSPKHADISWGDAWNASQDIYATHHTTQAEHNPSIHAARHTSLSRELKNLATNWISPVDTNRARLRSQQPK